MTFNVVLSNKVQYTITFAVDEEVTFCNIKDSLLNFVVSAGHSILSPDDDYNYIEGMKWALRRALEAPPSLFDRETRGLFWDSFWSALDVIMLEPTNLNVDWQND